MVFGQWHKTVWRTAPVCITPKMLTQVLCEMEDDQLIVRTVYFEVPPRVEYSLTESGRNLMPAIKMISTWGQEQMEHHNMAIMQEPEDEQEIG
jgi:DNA-binding HxlR family transcriptional regulator